MEKKTESETEVKQQSEDGDVPQKQQTVDQTIPSDSGEKGKEDFTEDSPKQGKETDADRLSSKDNKGKRRRGGKPRTPKEKGQVEGGEWKKNDNKLSNKYLRYLGSSPTPYHAVDATAKMLLGSGFTELKESEEWFLKKGGAYFFTRNDSSLFAFIVGKDCNVRSPFLIFGAHSDSPTLKVKKHESLYSNNYQSMLVQPYGGGQWTSWVDRDLKVAGIALVKREAGISHETFELPFMLRIPSLAIHLGGPRDEAKIDRQNEINPLINMSTKFNLKEEIARKLQAKLKDVLSIDARVVTAEKPALGGLSGEFIYAGQQDNLSMCFASSIAFCDLYEAKKGEGSSSIAVMALFDNEEVGSSSIVGAKSHFFYNLLCRIGHCVAKGEGQSVSTEDTMISFKKSLIVSADVSHGLHPYFLKKYDTTQPKPQLNSGIVVKAAVKQNQTTDFVGIAFTEQVALKYSIPLQHGVPRNDLSTGSTIGPHIAASTGIRVIDMGAPLLSMHSIREMGGTSDIAHSINLFKSMIKEFESNEILQ